MLVIPSKGMHMPYDYTNKKNGNTYTLHTRAVELKGGRKQVIYFFCKKGNKPASGKPCDMPDGKKVGVNERTGLPFLANLVAKKTATKVAAKAPAKTAKK